MYLNKRIGMGHIEELSTKKHFVFKVRHIWEYHGEYAEELKRFGKKGLINSVVVRFKTNSDNLIMDSSVEPLKPQPEKKYSELRGFSLFVRNLQLRWYAFKYEFLLSDF